MKVDLQEKACILSSNLMGACGGIYRKSDLLNDGPLSFVFLGGGWKSRPKIVTGMEKA